MSDTTRFTTREMKCFYQLIASRLRKAREARGVSQYKLAELTGFHRTTVANSEAGRMTPAIDSLIAFAQALKVDWQSLIPTRQAVRAAIEKAKEKKTVKADAPKGRPAKPAKPVKPVAAKPKPPAAKKVAAPKSAKPTKVGAARVVPKKATPAIPPETAASPETVKAERPKPEPVKAERLPRRKKTAPPLRKSEGIPRIIDPTKPEVKHEADS